MVVGVALGVSAPNIAKELGLISDIFLRLIKSIVAPLLFATLVGGIAGSGSVKAMGRIGLKAIIYFELVTTVALVLGLAIVNIAKPGVGLHINSGGSEAAVTSATPPSLGSVLEHTFPVSIVDSMAKGEVLQIVVFSFLFGAACAAIGAEAEPVVTFCNSLAEIMFRYTKYVMYLAPFGVGAALAVTVGTRGLGVLLYLGQLVAAMLGALTIFVVLVLGSVITLFRIPLKRFIKAVRQPFIIAFSTASSEAALPLALENMEAFGVPKHIVGFVLPTGYSFNLDGSTLYLSLASVFIAQAAGIQMPLTQQLMMMLTLMLTSKGVAAVPRASLVILAGTVTAFGLPVEGVAVLLAVDAVLDMSRTSVNVLGNCVASAVVARWEGYPLEPDLHHSVEVA